MEGINREKALHFGVWSLPICSVDVLLRFDKINNTLPRRLQHIVRVFVFQVNLRQSTL